MFDRFYGEQYLTYKHKAKKHSAGNATHLVPRREGRLTYEEREPTPRPDLSMQWTLHDSRNMAALSRQWRAVVARTESAPWGESGSELVCHMCRT